MATNRTTDKHLTSAELFGFIEKTLGRRDRLRVEQHLNGCSDCLGDLALVIRSLHSETEDEETALRQAPKQSPEDILQHLRPHIVSTSPPAGSLTARRWVWSQWVPVTAAVATLLVAFVAVHQLLILPSRGRQIARQAIADLVGLRQGTGRIPLRYIPGFQRARVTRSGFDAVHPEEDNIEAQLRRALAMAPREPDVHVALGLFLLDQGMLEEAEERLAGALDIAPQSSAAKNGLATVYFERAARDASQGRDLLRRGLELLREARRSQPNDPQSAFNIAVFYEELGSTDAAKTSWADYLQLDSGSEWAEVAAEKLAELGGR